jgi:L-lactate dehydrogenase (cytochrome)
MPAFACIEELRVAARRRVPRMFYDYVDAGSWTEDTYRANEADLAKIKFQQRVAVDIENRSLRSTMLGREVAMPVALAPTGLAGMLCPDGEILAARAAESFGVPFVLSMMSICSMEDIAAHTAAPFWMQLYILKDREFLTRLVERAKQARCDALVITLDLPVGGNRFKDKKNGLSAPPRFGVSTLLDLLTRPRWCLAMLGTRRHRFGNVVGHAKGVEDTASLSAWASQYDGSATWKDVEWLKRIWGGKLILKGITSVDDARSAVEVGADAIVVSNHGGRQLDGSPSAIASLRPVVDAVGHRLEVHMDGGIRSGQDVLRAVALGAHGTYVGRAFLYGLAAAGEAGVTRCLEIIKDELSRTMGLCGVRDVGDVGPHILANLPSFGEFGSSTSRNQRGLNLVRHPHRWGT